jgi:hypothetical protein
VSDEATRIYEGGVRAYAEPVSDAAFDGAGWETIRAAVPVNDEGASVLFIADGTTLTSAEHPILVVDLMEDGNEPFRCIPAELWSVDNNLNISNLDWEDFADAIDDDGVYRGLSVSSAQNSMSSSSERSPIGTSRGRDLPEASSHMQM